MAVIGAAHGIKGELRVKSFTADPTALGDYGPLRARDGRTFTVKTARQAKEVVIVRFAEVADRNAAEALSGVELFVDRSALPDDLDEEEFYHADLVGMEIVDESGAVLGTVLAIHDFGAGDIIEVRPRSGKSLMIPFTRAAVPHISLAERRMTIDSQAAGLVEDEDEDTQHRAEGDR
ncbi:MAG: ribosome maturation factor RimM [Rhizobiaceae bacterium]